MLKLNLRKIRYSNQGVAGIVVAILLIGLAITAIGFVQSTYVPQWMEKKEAEHMDTVLNQYSQLKYAIDTIGLLKQKNSIITTPFTLGSKEMPFLSSIRSYGSLEIEPNNGKFFCVSTLDDKEEFFPFGNICYSSKNGYHINQNYIYENGAVILSQDKGERFLIKPDIFFESDDQLCLNVIKLVPIGGKTSAGGYGTYPIQTKFKDSYEQEIIEVNEIRMHSPYHSLWSKYIINILNENNIGHSQPIDEVDGEGNIIGFKITFPNPSEPEEKSHLKVYLNVIEILCQISPGWVE